MRQRITIALDDGLAHWARAEAAERGISVSLLIGEMLAARMRAEEDYEAAQERFFAVRAQRLKQSGETYPKREDLHERPRGS